MKQTSFLAFFAKAFSLSILLAAFVMGIFFFIESKRLETRALLKAETVIQSQQEIFAEKLQMVAKDLLYLTKTELLQHYLDDPRPLTRANLAHELGHFSQVKGIYDQIRLLDTKGHERIRINYSAAAKTAVDASPKGLQDKSGRYYYKESIGLGPNEIYLSRLDLNVDNGQIERPFKPMLRFAKTVMDSNGKTAGILVINYLADDMLKTIQRNLEQTPGRFSLLDSGGFWLVSPDPQMAWGFMFEEKRNLTYAAHYPKIWKQILAAKHGTITTDSSMIYHALFSPVSTIQSVFAAAEEAPSTQLEQLIRSGENRWYLLHTIDDMEAPKLLLQSLSSTPYIYAFLMAALTAGIYLLLLFWQKRNEHLRALRIISEVYSSSNDGILITDENSRILKVNDAFTRITGYPEREVKGFTPAKIASGWTDKRIYEAMWDALTQHGYWEGEIWDRRKDGELYSEWLRITVVKDKRGHIANYVGVFTDITEQKESQKQIEQLAYYDTLTKLPNRNLFFDRLRHALENSNAEGYSTAVMLIDLDNFKYVNDTLGHLAGDKLLINVAERIKDCLQKRDTVARLGGDEFVVLVEDFGHIEKLTHIVQDIIEKVGKPQSILGEEVYVGASVGIAVYPDDADDQNLLIQYADTAMYRVKETGKSSYCFYTQELNDAVNERVKIETYLRTDIAKGAFELHYQPQVDNRDGKVVGAEALIRWQHEELGSVPPMKFITIAEDSGLIIPLSEWVVIRGLEEIVKLKERDIHIKVALNISPIHMMDDTFIPFVENQMRHSGCDPRMVEFEITESSLAVEREKVRYTIMRLKEMGITIAVDDFGTGYSSLSYLKHFPIDKLKVDRAFVTGLPEDANDVNLTTAIISISNSFSMNILAEGVETGQQLDFLQCNGCHVIQGFYYSRPLPFEAFVEYVKEKGQKSH